MIPTRLAALGMLAAAMASLAGAAYWAWQGRPVAMADVQGGLLDCVSYTPYDGSSSPLDKPFDADIAAIRADLAALRPYVRCIRTYSALGPVPKAVAVAAEHKFEVWQGIWISGNAEKDAKEIAAGIALARAYPGTISLLVVGNEVLLRRELPGTELARIIRSVKAQSPVPVTYADIFEFWRRNPALASAVDVVTLHVLPYWDDPAPVSIDAVQESVAGVIGHLRALFPASEIAIGEAGWPSLGRTRGGATPSRVNQARFLREFVNSPAVRGLRINLIEGIDQPWKRGPEGTVGGYWGLLDAARDAKFPLTGPVVERPAWRVYLGVSLGLSLAVFAGGLAWAARLEYRAMRGSRIVVWAVVAQIAGSALVEAVTFVWSVARDPIGWIGGSGGLLLAAVAVRLLAAAVLRPDVPRMRPAGFALLFSRTGWTHLAHLDAGAWLGAWRIALLLPAAWLALAIGFDGRHRDLPIALLLLPAMALIAPAVHQMATDAGLKSDEFESEGPEEAWLALALIVGALAAFEGFSNVEALAWSALGLALALPFGRALRAEAKRIGADVRARLARV